MSSKGKQRRIRIAATLVVALAAVGLGMLPVHAGEESFPVADLINWQKCADTPEAECGFVAVPVNWSQPDGPLIDIAVSRRKATDPAARIGVMLVDPGGPALPGAQMVREGGFLATFSAEVRRRFDIVGFDRRGLNDSSPVLCPEVAPPDGPVDPVDPFPTTDEGLGELTGLFRAEAEGCRKSTGSLFDHLDGTSMVRDMDAIRIALGERQLTHFDVSFGTMLGQQYAELFPDRVRAMVLDSNVDHSLTSTDSYLRSATRGVQDSFDQYVAWCRRSTGCALHQSDARKVFRGLYAKAERGELMEPGTTDRIDTFGLISETTDYFYGPRWAQLADRQAQLAGQSPTVNARKSAPAEDPEVRTDSDGGAMACENWRLPVRDAAELQAILRDLGRIAPDMKVSSQAWAVVLGCARWPGPVPNPQRVLHWKGVPPVLMLNGLHDPATPYEGARKVARQTGAVLLTYEGAGHEVTAAGSRCVTAVVDSYLLSGVTPPKDMHCAAVPVR